MDKHIVLHAIRRSIKHWCLDVKRPLMKGRVAESKNGVRVEWKDSGKSLKVGARYCALCKLFFMWSAFCSGCPITQYHIRCTTSHSPYELFFESPTLEHANFMIDALVSVYHSYLNLGIE